MSKMVRELRERLPCGALAMFSFQKLLCGIAIRAEVLDQKPDVPIGWQAGCESLSDLLRSTESFHGEQRPKGIAGLVRIDFFLKCFPRIIVKCFPKIIDSVLE